MFAPEPQTWNDPAADPGPWLSQFAIRCFNPCRSVVVSSPRPAPCVKPRSSPPGPLAVETSRTVTRLASRSDAPCPRPCEAVCLSTVCAPLGDRRPLTRQPISSGRLPTTLLDLPDDWRPDVPLFLPGERPAPSRLEEEWHPWDLRLRLGGVSLDVRLRLDPPKRSRSPLESLEPCLQNRFPPPPATPLPSGGASPGGAAPVRPGPPVGRVAPTCPLPGAGPPPRPRREPPLRPPAPGSVAPPAMPVPLDPPAMPYTPPPEWWGPIAARDAWIETEQRQRNPAPPPGPPHDPAKRLRPGPYAAAATPTAPRGAGPQAPQPSRGLELPVRNLGLPRASEAHPFPPDPPADSGGGGAAGPHFSPYAPASPLQASLRGDASPPTPSVAPWDPGGGADSTSPPPPCPLSAPVPPRAASPTSFTWSPGSESTSSTTWTDLRCRPLPPGSEATLLSCSPRRPAPTEDLRGDPGLSLCGGRVLLTERFLSVCPSTP
ncbi:hypothetical protein XELAEV_18009651mg [Xenopus laevis]|uniref:Uncharacterized protein n=1 Tax=Xenopus laevis TaxID=8355 RepID=A0A974I0Z2_XENLA|nr:hypothetical protein XELAEV_18009651mg [Xenopus laevis]